MPVLEILQRLKIRIEKQNVVNGFCNEKAYQRTSVKLYWTDLEGRDILLSEDFVDDELKV
ncbi:MAG: hypothetical protein IKS48_00395 [Eubacterium sp.]|nr:hypothetical protein [Eubacterium sp.]